MNHDLWSLIKPARRNSSSVLHFVTRIRKFLAASVIKFREGMACVRLAWLMGNLNCKEKCLNGEVVWGNIDSWSGSPLIKSEMKYFTGILCVKPTKAPSKNEWH